MHITTETPIWGIEEKVLRWSKAEAQTLKQAARLLFNAREAVGLDTDLGTDLGKAEVVLRDYQDGALVETNVIPAGKL